MLPYLKNEIQNAKPFQLIYEKMLLYYAVSWYAFSFEWLWWDYELRRWWRGEVIVIVILFIILHLQEILTTDEENASMALGVLEMGVNSANNLFTKVYFYLAKNLVRSSFSLCLLHFRIVKLKIWSEALK